MGLLVTLDLIATNVYNSVKAPSKRGFSYIEIWMIGVHIPILLGILEYAFLLTLKKYFQLNIKTNDTFMVRSNDKSNWDKIEKRMDKWTFFGSLIFIVIFNIIYWLSALV